MYKQVIVVNKELKMSSGKLAAQVSHASMAFLTWKIRNTISMPVYGEFYQANFFIEKEMYEQWMDGSFTKVILQAKNENKMNKIISLAIENGLREGVDFFCIKDECRTELEPDIDGKRWTCIGFAPMAEAVINKVTGQLQLYREKAEKELQEDYQLPRSDELTTITFANGNKIKSIPTTTSKRGLRSKIFGIIE